MSEVKRFDEYTCGVTEAEDGEYVKHSDYAKLADEAQALREEVARSEQHRNDQADLIVSLRTEVAALKHSQQVLIGSRNAHRDERDAARKEVAAMRARVVVLPDASTVYAELDARERLFTSPENIQVALEAQSRLNGLTVSEGLLRRISNLFPADMGDDGSGRAGWFPHVRETVAELRALLDAGKEDDRDEA
ncbi:hypothetical protein [Pseudomonas aeruginosa]|uniref:hypothetical protein n=1 Tax=Pseudomonas aeruginosa TaxID=287 RepID=UPI00053EA2CA|nr:hypothetical protein [Pseudomonas aeruginosa]